MAGGASSNGADRAGDEGESWRTPARHLASSPPPAGLRSVTQVAQEQHQGHVSMTQHGFLAPEPGRHHSRPAGSAGVFDMTPGDTLGGARFDACHFQTGRSAWQPRSTSRARLATGTLCACPPAPSPRQRRLTPTPSLRRRRLPLRILCAFPTFGGRVLLGRRSALFDRSPRRRLSDSRLSRSWRRTSPSRAYLHVDTVPPLSLLVRPRRERGRAPSSRPSGAARQRLSRTRRRVRRRRRSAVSHGTPIVWRRVHCAGRCDAGIRGAGAGAGDAVSRAARMLPRLGGDAVAVRRLPVPHVPGRAPGWGGGVRAPGGGPRGGVRLPVADGSGDVRSSGSGDGYQSGARIFPTLARRFCVRRAAC
jgi:hypothetical protein